MDVREKATNEKRLIDVDEAIVNFGFEWGDIPPTREEFVRFLKKQPTVDAVEVVRCWECKYHEDTDVTGFKHCCLIDKTVRYNDFCSYGKRKGGAD